jgi:hypothetical protein
MSVENKNCAALDLCLFKTLPCTHTHICPACHLTVHAICGEICEEATIQFHTTCFKCFAMYGVAFKDPEAFHAYQLLIKEPGHELAPHGAEDAAPDMLGDDMDIPVDDTIRMLLGGGGVGEATAGHANTVNRRPLEIDMYKIGLKDSATLKIDKAKKRRDFIKGLTLAQCTIEQDGDSSQLISIGAVPLSKLLLNDLMLFCATHKISGYRQKKKEEVALLIAAKIASDNIYASIGRLGMTMERDNAGGGGRGKQRSSAAYRSKQVRPKAVTKTGSYFRAISLWFSSQNRHLVLATGKKMNRAELDVGGYRHKSIWDNLADQYNKNTGLSTGEQQDGDDNSYLDVIQAPHPLYGSENPEDFDQLDGQDLAQFIRWITNQYYVVHKSVSGDHARFEDRVGEKAYLLYFHNMISATGAENIESLMKAQLTKDVFAESNIDGSVVVNELDTPTTAAEPKRPRRTYNKLGPPPSSSAKERTDEAILKYINSSLMENSSDQDSRSTRSMSRIASRTSSTGTSAKDEYIREKKRIAVRVDDVAMAREVSDSVDLSLQKWKATLKDLQEMEADGIPTNHPIFTATKATADLHESAFNAYLARAKVQQDELIAPRVLNLARDTAGLLPSAVAVRSPASNDYHTPASSRMTSSILDISNCSTSFRSSNDDDEEEEELPTTASTTS